MGRLASKEEKEYRIEEVLNDVSFLFLILLENKKFIKK